MVVSAKAEKEPDGWDSDLGGWKRKGNLAVTTIMWIILLAAAVLIFVFFKKKAME